MKAQSTRALIFATTAVAVALLAGCATVPMSSTDAEPGTPITNDWQSPKPGTGKFVVTRDTGFAGAACAQRVSVDTCPIADLRTGQTVTVYLPQGEHVAGVETTGICGGGNSSAEVNITAGSTKYYRVGSGQSGDLKIEGSAFR
jgi:hypothetical protein